MLRKIDPSISGHHFGDCRELLGSLPDACVQTCVTSPPYWALRAYPKDDENAHRELGQERHPREFVAKLVDIWVRSRPTKSHEYMFLLSKSEDYFYNVDAIREPQKTRGERHECRSGYRSEHPNRTDVPNKYGVDRRALHPLGKNRTTVWNVATSRYPKAHFATFPPALIEPCILAGSRRGDVVLDPFFGSGTTGMVAEKHGRRWIGFDLNPAYEALQRERVASAGARP